MPLYLNEDEVVSDPHVIGYPHLVLCMGMTLQMDNGHLIGGHFVSVDSQKDVGARIARQITAHGGTPVRMYLTGNFYMHVQGSGGRDYTGKAALIGYHGPVFCFDTASIKPELGTFVRLTSLGEGRGCLVEYKREEKVIYTDAHGRVGRHRDANPKKLPTASTYHIRSVSTASGKPLHVVKNWTLQAQV